MLSDLLVSEFWRDQPGHLGLGVLLGHGQCVDSLSDGERLSCWLGRELLGGSFGRESRGLLWRDPPGSLLDLELLGGSSRCELLGSLLGRYPLRSLLDCEFLGGMLGGELLGSLLGDSLLGGELPACSGCRWAAFLAATC